jgi:hypothetical protein
MRTLITAALAASLLSIAPASAAPRLSPEQKLARELEGRVAGEPRRCINLSRTQSSRIIDNTAIVFQAGSTIWVNRPRAGAESLDEWDTLVTRPFGSQLCSIDVVHLYDTTSRFQSGVVFLGDFVPYKRVSSR